MPKNLLQRQHWSNVGDASPFALVAIVPVLTSYKPSLRVSSNVVLVSTASVFWNYGSCERFFRSENLAASLEHGTCPEQRLHVHFIATSCIATWWRRGLLSFCCCQGISVYVGRCKKKVAWLMSPNLKAEAEGHAPSKNIMTHLKVTMEPCRPSCLYQTYCESCPKIRPISPS